MSAVGMDPTFTKAYRLLFSTEPDSAEQMRAMLDEALKQKYGTHKTLTSVLPKKLMIEERPYSPSPTANLDEPDSEVESNHTPDNDEDELTLDLLEEDLTCVVCKEMGFGARNRLVECLECHSLYHQECHQPPITEASDFDDPRLAWYCATCKKNMNKTISNIKSTKPTATIPSVAPKPTPPVGGKPPFTSSKAFTGTSSKSSTNLTKSSSSTKTSGGVGNSAASSSSSSSSSSSNNNNNNNNSNNNSSGSGSSSLSSKSSKPTSSSTSKAAIPNINIISADKRLQMMKKKAAAANKNQDKGKHSK